MSDGSRGGEAPSPAELVREIELLRAEITRLRDLLGVQEDAAGTVSAPQVAIRTLEAEAQRRRVPLATLLREAVEEKARELRRGRRPRVGVARSTDGRIAAEVTAEPVAEEPH